MSNNSSEAPAVKKDSMVEIHHYADVFGPSPFQAILTEDPYWYDEYECYVSSFIAKSNSEVCITGWWRSGCILATDSDGNLNRAEA